MSVKISKLHIHDPHRSMRVGEILVQPASESCDCDLFILIELDSNTPEDLELIRQFLEICYEIYEKSQLHQADKILENILQALNEYLPEIAPKNFNWHKKLHAYIGLISGNEIHFSVIGKIKAFMVKPNYIKDIIGKIPESDKSDLFDFTVSGQIQPSDKFLITTESLPNYVSLEKIKKIISTLPPQSSIAHLSNILESVPPTVSFFSLIIQFSSSLVENDEIPSKSSRLKTPAGSENSMTQLLKTQAETEKILSPPSIFETLKENLKKKSKAPAQKIAVTQTKSRSDSDEKKKKLPVKITKPGKLSLFIRGIITTGYKTGQLIKNLWLFTTQQKNRNQFLTNITKKLASIIKRFSRLSKTNKVLIISTIILILLFSQSLIWQERKIASQRLNETYTGLLIKINEKQEAIEASLIYNDTIRVRQLIGEINLLLVQLPQQTKEQQAKHLELSQKIQVLFERVWKVTNILEPVTLINFREINLTAEISHLGYKDSFIYGFNNTNQVFAVNVNDNSTVVLDNFNLKSTLAATFSQNNSLIISTDNNEFYSVNQNELQKIAVSLPPEVEQIDYLTFYLDKMYALDKETKQIYRFSFDGNNFGRTRAWITEDLPIDKTVSIALDGFIYGLQENGEILKLAGGKSQGFPTLVIEPSLSSPTKIFTNEETNSLYILDPVNKRFVIFDKNGELKNQFFSEQFNNLKDFIIDKSQQKAYLLNGAQVFVISIK